MARGHPNFRESDHDSGRSNLSISRNEGTRHGLAPNQRVSPDQERYSCAGGRRRHWKLAIEWAGAFAMKLPLVSPYPPMEARTVDEIPAGSEWQYEPKWDGFRCLAFREGSHIELQSKSGQPLARYFPDLVESLQSVRATKFVLDGEIVIPVNGELSFDDLLLRIHPAASRVNKLAAERPGVLIVFDLLVNETGKSLVARSLSERRLALEMFANKFLRSNDSVLISPATRDVKVARQWFGQSGSSLDGVIAKRLDLSYQSGLRTGMQKIKNLRSADCVVGGFRYASSAKVAGSLLLGLYDEEGLLHHVGFTSGLTEQARRKLTPQLEALVKPPGFTGQAPGGPSRWTTQRSGEWQPLAPKLVLEVQYDHFTGGRFRHGTRFLRWRPEKSPRQCTFDQVSRMGSKVSLLPPKLKVNRSNRSRKRLQN
jgi:ATP-dependent DNA ligase